VPCGDICQTGIVVRGWEIDTVTVTDPMGQPWRLVETEGNSSLGSTFHSGLWSQGPYPDQADYNGAVAPVTYEGGMPDGDYTFVITSSSSTQVVTGVISTTMPEQDARSDRFSLEYFGSDGFTFLGVEVRFNRFILEPLEGSVSASVLAGGGPAVVLPEPGAGSLGLVALGLVATLGWHRRRPLDRRPGTIRRMG
jgi:hypothetical protein